MPSIEQMIAKYGSGEEWQRANTIEWMVKIARVPKPGRKQLFEGQTRLSFLAEGAATRGLNYRAILVDCDDETRLKRLTIDRGRPELANKELMNWARYLRHSARIKGCEIPDTSLLSVDESVSFVSERLDG